MRHRSKKITLDRNARQRRPLLRNLAISLITHERITTTGARARAIRPMVEKVITMGKVSSLASRRLIISTLADAKAAHKVLTVLGPRYATRPGGYLRIIKRAPRIGDNAEQVVIEFV